MPPTFLHPGLSPAGSAGRPHPQCDANRGASSGNLHTGDTGHSHSDHRLPLSHFDIHARTGRVLLSHSDIHAQTGHVPLSGAGIQPHSGATPTPGPTPTMVPDLDGDGYSPGAGDCDDADPAVNPGAVEACDQVDNDCDGMVDEDVTIPVYLDRM